MVHHSSVPIINNKDTNPGFNIKFNTTVNFLTIIIVTLGFVIGLRKTDLSELKETDVKILSEIRRIAELQMEDRWRIETMEKRLESIEKYMDENRNNRNHR